MMKQSQIQCILIVLKLKLDKFKILKSIFPDTIHQYKDKNRYQFNCDFYIPSIDTFIECQYSWVHGGHPFDINNADDVAKLNTLKERYGDKWWPIWAERDVNKRNVAQQNNLNYIEFWNINELRQWVHDWFELIT